MRVEISPEAAELVVKLFNEVAIQRSALATIEPFLQTLEANLRLQKGAAETVERKAEQAEPS